MAASTDKQSWVGEFTLKAGQAPRRGELAYHPTEGIELRISDVNPDAGPRSILSNDLADYETISGVVEGLRPVTLINCFDGGLTGNLSGFEHRRIIVGKIVFGVRDLNPSKRLFKAAHLSTPNLTQWVGSLGFETSSPKRGLRVSFKWAPPKGYKAAQLDEQRKISGFFGYSRSFGLVDGKIPFEIRPRIELRYRNQQSVTDVVRDLYALELLSASAPEAGAARRAIR